MPDLRLSDGVRIAYEVVGDGEPLLLIPGTGQGGALWALQIPAYLARFRCILVDNRGAGRSDAPTGGYSVRRMADDAAELLRALDVARAHVSGQSMGSAIGQELAINAPELVHTLQLHSTWDRTVAYPHLERQLTLRRELARRDLWDLFAMNSPLWLFPAEFVNAHGDEIRAREAQLFANHPPAHGLAGHFQADLDHDARGRLAGIAAPTLVTYGRHDLVTLPAYNEAVADQIPGARRHVFEAAGHLPFSQCPDEFNAVTLAFMAEHPLSARARGRGAAPWQS
jgi:pimeloyl-ACP methyl ester carboxylesterase